MLNGPVFTAEPPRSTGGDFLGMGVVGERLYGGVFPGLNNAVRHVRPYAALCWMVHRIREQAFAAGKVEPAELRRQMRQGIWKMQLLINWVAKLDDMQGYPGGNRFKDDPEHVLLKKESWPGIDVSSGIRPGTNPACVNGFRFLDQGKPGLKDVRDTYSCTEAGIALAGAYDAAVQALDPELAKWLADPDALACTKAQVEALRPVLQLDLPSSLECDEFLRQFVGAEFERADAEGRERRKGIVLALRAMAALEEEGTAPTVEMIRHAMAAGVTPGGTGIRLDGVEAIQVRWCVLQLRALQRLAMEALLALAERQIVAAEGSRAPRRLGDIAEAVASLLSPGGRGSLLPTVEENMAWIRRQQGGYPLAQAAAMVERIDRIDPAFLKARLRKSVGHKAAGWGQAARDAVWTLIFCAVEVENLRSVPGAKAMLAWDEGRVSLGSLSALVKKCGGEPVHILARRVVESLVVNQHLKVAVERSAGSQDGKTRFVFSQERDGLARTAHGRGVRFLEVAEASDILFHALLMLENCGQLSYAASEYSPANSQRFDAVFTLTGAGRELLQRYG
jgi:hypothetical protein